MKRKFLLTAIFTLSLAGILICGFLGRDYAKKHVAYYMGGTVPTINCVLCHIYAKGGTLTDRMLKPQYITPLSIASCKNGNYLYVTAQDANALLVVNAKNKRIVSKIPVGKRPHSVTVLDDCKTAFVSAQYSNHVSVIDLTMGKTVSSLSTGMGPAGVMADQNNNSLYTANWAENNISIFNLSDGTEKIRLSAGSNPNKMALSPDKKRLLVTNQLSYITHYPDPPASEVTEIDLDKGRIKIRHRLDNAHMLGGVAFAPKGDIALMTLVRPKNLLPALQVERGWMMTNGIAVIDIERGSSMQLPLDDIDSFYADPSDVVITPDGKYAFVSHGGVDTVTVIDMSALRALYDELKTGISTGYANRLSLSRKYVVKRILTKSNPRGMTVSHNSKFVYVAERLADSIAIIDVEHLEITGRIDLGGSRHISILRQGERLFHNAKISFQNQFSCLSCHPNQHLDRLQYDLEPDGLGRNILDNRTLLGIRNIGPYKWNGKNTSLYMQCGIRFSRFLTRSAPFDIYELNALVVFINSLDNMPRITPLNADKLTTAQERGKEIFERAITKDGKPIPEEKKCITCHPLPYYTNIKMADVGSSGANDSIKAFDIPQLINIATTAPYLHNGKALTLEEIWTIYSPDDTHGIVKDIGKEGLNDLIEYLKIL